VAYLNGSKVLTTGSALTFDGVDLATTGGVRNAGSFRSVVSTTDAIFGANQFSSGVVGIGSVSNHPISFNINLNEQMRLTSTGLGIGTSSPGVKLDVIGASQKIAKFFAQSSYGQLEVGTTGANQNVYLTLTPNGTGLGIIQHGTGDVMTFNSSGNLGLGVTPSAWDSSWKAFQIGTRAGFVSAGDSSSIISQNAQFNSGWKYISTAAAGLYVAAFNGQHQWFTAPSGTAGNAISFTQAMTLDASGRLGVGTTSPSSPIHVVGNSASNFLLGGIRINDTNTSSDFFIGGVTGGGFQIATAGGATRAVIDTSGNLLVGSTTFNNGRINTVTASGLWGIAIRDVFGNQAMIQFVNSAGAQAGSITISGTTTTYGSGSDYRLKDEIVPMTGALEKVQALKPVTWKWKADGSDGQGFIAHELAEVCPDAVHGDKDAVNKDGSIKPQMVDTSFLVATLTAAVQEQQAIITALTARVAALESN
jgi:hypothetical protein